jgi:hypothetical protein
MDHRRAGDREDEAGRAFVQEARESLGMGRFVLPADSLTLGPMAHTFVNLNTIAEAEEHDSPKQDSRIPSTVKSMDAECSCSAVSVVKNELLNGAMETETHTDPVALFGAHVRSTTFGTHANTREPLCFNPNDRASAMDRRLLSFRSRRWALGLSSKELKRDMSTTPITTTFKLEEQPRIVLQGLSARFEESSRIPLLGNNKAPAPPQRQKSRRNDLNDDDDDDDELIIETEAISTVHQGPSNDPRHRNEFSR